MSENKIKVTATTSTKPVRVSVSTPATQGNVTFSQDTSAYNANLAQQWAVSENLVLGQDYSSKYYANKAKESATNATNTYASIQDTYQDFQEETNNAFNELNVSKAEVLGEIDVAKNNAVDSINTTKTTIITGIEFVADGEKKEIEDLADIIKDSAEDIIGRVGISMFDTILKDHVLTYEESKGLALQGTYVYKDAIPGSRYGYPDFYNKVVEEFENSSNEKKYLKSNVNLVGALTDEQGLLSGFSTSAYATLPTRFAPTNGDTWEMVIKFNSPDVSTNQGLFGYNDTGLVRLSFIDNKVTLYLSTSTSTFNIGSLAGTTVLTANTDYWVKVIFNGTSYQLLLSTDGIVFNLESSLESTKIPVFPSTSMLGFTNVNPNKGTIDLNESYININGNRWWTGTDILEYKKNPNGHMFYNIADKTVVDDIFASTGMAWMYGVDTENERIFLPRNNWFEQIGDISEVGNSVEAGLPNITGSGPFTPSSSGTLTGAFYKSGSQGGNTSDGGEADSKIVFDASRCSDIYGKSDTVQPNAIKKLLYICVGNTEIQSTITDVVDVTTTKNDTFPLGYHFYQDSVPPSISYLKSEGQWNDGNIYTTFYNEFVKKIGESFANGYVKDVTESYDDYDLVINQTDMTFRLPLLDGSEDLLSDKLINLTISATDENFIAPANGWVSFSKASSAANQYNAITVRNGVRTDSYSAGNGNWCTVNAPVFKGDSYKIQYSTGGDVKRFVFIYAQGKGSLYFKVANAVQNLELLDVGEVMEAVNNVVPNNKSLIVEYSTNAVMPDYTTAVSVTTKTYTASYKGWLVGFCATTGNTTSTGYINNVIISQEYGDYQDIQILMDKGDVFTTNAGSVNLNFCALKGAG